MATKMRELIFLVEEAQEGGFTTHALGESIVTEGDNWEELKANVREAVEVHFDEDELPATVSLRLMKEEMLAI